MLAALRFTPLPLIAIGLFLFLLAAIHLGRVVARRTHDGRKDENAGNLATGMLGIFALLSAFTYSMALARYDQRRSEVLQEANAIGSTANDASLLPEPHRAAILALLRRYAETRVALGAPNDGAAFADRIAASNAVMTRLWAEARAVSAEQPQSLPVYRFVAALSDQSNIAEARITALRNHVPVVVLMALVATAAAALGFAEWSTALGGYDRHLGLGVTATIVTLLIALTMDLDRPDRGSIEVSKQPLRDALATMPGALPPGPAKG